MHGKLGKGFDYTAIAQSLMGDDMGLNTPPKTVLHHSPEGMGAENQDLSSTYSNSHPIKTICLKIISGIHVVIWARQAFKGRVTINIVALTTLLTSRTNQTYRSQPKRPLRQGISTALRFELISQS